MDNNIEVLLRFKESWRRVDKMYDTYAKAVGLNFTEILILEILCEPGSHTQKALCTKLGLPKQFINTIINSFREDSLVVLTEAKDRRNKEICLTEKGKLFTEKVLIPLQKMEESALENFTADELSYCTALSEKYEESFEGLLNEFISRQS
jgi:DNA-binding MarR family transcriptional regulator